MARVTIQLAGREFEIDDAQLDHERGELARLPPATPTRLVFAAAHLVMRDEYAEVAHTPEQPGASAELAEHVDWPRTFELRRRLDGLGFGIAEAMDTAQRFSVGWSVASRLIEGCGEQRLANGFVAGASSDSIAPTTHLDALVAAIVEQARFIQRCGGWPMLLPISALAQLGADEDLYVATYRRILEQLDGPVFVHWLGEMFAPALRGYFPGRSFERVMELDPAKVRGAKLSLLDDALELRLRRALLERDQLLLTGDDFHFAGLIGGGDPSAGGVAPPVERDTDVGGRRVSLGDFSHALLGAFDGVAAPAGVALQWLARGELDRYTRLMAPCEALARVVFEPPTQRYKCGLAFLAWLNGLQPNFQLANHEERLRDVEHYARVAELAARAGAIENAEIAAARLATLR